jgi:hypothetical protein
VEIAFTRSGDPGEKSTAPRMDLALLVPWKSGGARLFFCEAKCADNVGLWKLEKKSAEETRRIAVVSQIANYEEFICKNEKTLIDAYVSVCQTLIELRKQGLKRKLDPLIEGVAEGMSLTVNPRVYLLVYAFGRDEKNGVLKNRLETLHAKDKLGDRVIAKGNARNFRLSEDICRNETAQR